MNKNSKYIFLAFVGLVFLNYINQFVYKRFDLTEDQRYTLSETTNSMLSKVDKTTHITVYLEGEFPSEFKRLQIETKDFLEELRAKNKYIKIQFENPDNQRERLIKKGMMPSQLTVEENGKVSEAIIFPWAEIRFKNKTSIVSLLPNSMMSSQEQQLQKAIENLEYSFMNGFHKIIRKSKKNIALLTGKKGLQDIQLYSFLSKLSDKYSLSKFTLDSVKTNPQQTLEDLTTIDLAIIAKPTEKFTEKEKFTLDQYVMNGGKIVWMLDNVQADQDSLMATGKMLAYPRDLNLTDLLFSYGVRVSTSIIKDLYASKIALATGNIGNQTQFQNLDWFYHPLVAGNPNHPITKNIANIRLQFANQIDTLKNSIKKTPLLISSPLTKKVGTPTIVELQSIAETPKEENYTSGSQLFSVLLEGNFKSAYKNRVKPFKSNLFKASSFQNKMIVIADGDIGKNQLLKGNPTDLAIDKWTKQSFGNKDFLVNAVDYLLDDTGLIKLRNKQLKIKMLDKKKAFKERVYWQILNVIFPLVLLTLFGIVFHYFRKKKYA